MCLSFPGRIVTVNGDYATVDYGENGGTRGNINVALVEAKAGDYVLVQGGLAIRVLSPDEAEESLKAWRMILEELQSPLAGARGIDD